LVSHARGRIKYWEIWNEPGGQGRDPYKLLYDIVIPAQKIIKSDSHHLIVTSPANAIGVIGGNNDGADWMNAYLALGGGTYADVMAVHQYPPTGETAPESILTSLSKFEAVFSGAGVGRKPLWGTEGSFGRWGGEGQPTRAQSAYVAKQAILLWSTGVIRNYWYGYDSTLYGTLCTKPGITCSPSALSSGRSYLQTFVWLYGASVKDPCHSDGYVWTCQLERDGGYSGLMIWNASGSSTYDAPPEFRTYCDLKGNFRGDVPNPLAIGLSPLLLETSRRSC
jgi:hypothetical protein